MARNSSHGKIGGHVVHRLRLAAALADVGDGGPAAAPRAPARWRRAGRSAASRPSTGWSPAPLRRRSCCCCSTTTACTRAEGPRRRRQQRDERAKSLHRVSRRVTLPFGRSTRSIVSAPWCCASRLCSTSAPPSMAKSCAYGGSDADHDALAPRAPVDGAQRGDVRLHQVDDELVAGERRQVRLEARGRVERARRVRARIDRVDASARRRARARHDRSGDAALDRHFARRQRQRPRRVEDAIAQLHRRRRAAGCGD